MPIKARILDHCALSGTPEFTIDGQIHCACAGSICKILEGLNCESPWRLRTENTSRGPRPAVLPRSPETGREYSNYSLARIGADIGRFYGVGHQQSFGSSSEASGGTPGDAGGLRSNHRGIGGICLWLAARIAQHRCESEWRHLGLAKAGLHSRPSASSR